MLGKLLKYDFKSLYKSIIPVYIITLILAVVVKLLDILSDKISIFSFMYSLTLLLFILSLFVTFLYAFFVSIRRFYNSMLKDAAYLTHTLPVEKKVLVLSQCISSFIVFINSIFVIIVALLIPFYRDGLINDISALLTLGMEGTSTAVYFASFIVSMLMSYLEYIVVFMLALSLGHAKISNKIANSFVYGIVIYIVIQFVSSVMLGIVWISFPSIRDMLGSNIVTVDGMITLLIAMNIMQVLIIAASYFITVKTIKTKLNLE